MRYRIVSVITGVAVLAGLIILDDWYGIGIRSWLKGRSDGPEDVQSALSRLSSEANRTLPRMIDAETRLDRTLVDPGRTFVYEYTFVNFSKPDRDWQEIRKAVQDDVSATYKRDPNLQSLRMRKVVLRHRYRDRDGAVVFEVTASPW